LSNPELLAEKEKEEREGDGQTGTVILGRFFGRPKIVQE
jgi:hypothetical protein